MNKSKVNKVAVILKDTSKGKTQNLPLRKLEQLWGISIYTYKKLTINV